MQLSPLQLLEYAIDRVEIRAIDGFDNSRRDPLLVMPPEGVRMGSEVGITVLQESEAFSDYGLKFTLTVSAEPPATLPYEVCVAMVGSVRMHGEPDRDKRQTLALVNGVSLLCGAVRDVVASVTSRARYGQMLLPTLNFAKLAEQASASPRPVPARPMKAIASRKKPTSARKRS